jgi:glycosyltransferase involved in cell wall biosynthesis
MKILFLSRWFPFPSDNGSRQRVAALLRALSGRHEVHLLSFTQHDHPYACAAKDGIDLEKVHTVSYPSSGRPWSPVELFFDGPRSVVRRHSRSMQECARYLAERHSFDLVIASEIDMIPYVIDLPIVRRVSDGLEIGVYHDALRRPWLNGGLRARLRWGRLTRYLRRSLQAFMLCTTVSEREHRLIDRTVAPSCALAVTPNGVDVAACEAVRATPQPDTMIYAGALTYAPNFDAMSYFISSILPRIRAERPAVRLRITGAAPADVQARLPQDPSVEFTGYLADVRTAVASSWVSVVPLRIGSGTRLKILESMALGVPVITTSKGAEGLQLRHGAAALVGDDPDLFADHVLEVLANRDLRNALAARARRIVADRYDWQAIGDSFVRRIDELQKRPESPHLHRAV